MTLEYELAPSDYVAFALHHHAHSPSLQKTVRWARFGFPAVWLTLGLIPVVLGKPLGGAEAISVGFAILWVLFVPSYLRWSIPRGAARHYQRGFFNGQIGAHRIEVTETGLRDSTPISDWRISWPGVEHVADSPEHVFVYVGANAAVIIPKNALGDRLGSFQQAVEDRRTNHAQG